MPQDLCVNDRLISIDNFLPKISVTSYSAMTVGPKIGIIGCGASGLSAATRLLEHGFSNILILEAEDRIGGRIHTVEFGRGVVDLGAQWCHGEKDNIVHKMVKGLNLLDHSFNDYEDNTYYHSSGKIIDKALTDKLIKLVDDIREDQETANQFSGTFGDYFTKRYQEKVAEILGSDREVVKTSSQMLDWFHKFVLCLESSKSWFDIPAKSSYKECEGDLLLQWKGKGFKVILDVLLKKHSHEKNIIDISDKFLLNKELVEISWDIPSNSEVILKCRDGSIYNCDHVIVTVSLGVLKKFHASIFKPELPLFKVNAIEGLSIGTVDKIFLQFSTKWWPDDLKGFSLVWSEDDKANILSEFSEGPSRNGRSWLEDVFGFYVVDCQPNVLLGWIVGEMAGEVELLSDEVVLAGCMYLLKKFVAHKYEVCEPDQILRSKWYTNPHFLGSYSYVSMDTVCRRTEAADLALPVANSTDKQVLLFSGEATHSHYYSTVHGAIESGYREADRIIDMYKPRELVKKVAVIGAGIAGIGAALTFIANGCDDIVILEAQDRTGGRILSINYES